MKCCKFLQARSFAVVLVSLMLAGTCAAVPLNNPYDTQPLYSYFGTDKYYKDRDEGEIKIHISAVYQHANTARNAEGLKVPGGERLGNWNAYGLFFNDRTILGAVPAQVSLADKPFIANNYPNLFAAYQAVSGSNGAGVPANLGGIGGAARAPNTITRYFVANSVVGGNSLQLNPAYDFTNKANFTPEKAPFALLNVASKYEKIGIRGQISFDFGSGIGVSVRGGAVDIKNRGIIFLEGATMTSTAGAAGTLQGDVNAALEAIKTGGVPGDQKQVDALELYNKLFSPAALAAACKDVDISLATFRQTSPEDLHMQLYWHMPMDMFDKEDSVGVVFVPYLSAGAWLPIAKKFDQNQAFAVPVGNNGVYGITLDAALGFDFPVVPNRGETFQVSVGGGVLINGEQSGVSERFPSSPFQVGLMPWKTTVLTKPGMTWHMNASMKAENFVDGLSIYLDYIYTQHLHDKFTLKEADEAKLAEFKQGLDTKLANSVWKNQQVNAGLNYDITPVIALNVAAQAHISGVRVQRAVTLMGGLTVTF